MRTVSSLLILVLVVSGCATARYRPSATVSAADQKACEQVAEADAASVKGESVAGGVVGGFFGGLVFGTLCCIFGGFLTAPAGAIWGGVDTTSKNSELRSKAYEKAMETCLEPIVLEQRLGPEHPDVALSLHNLAYWHVNREHHAQAEPIYERALAIREKALGMEHPDVAATLEAYAALLRKTNREVEAERMETRAKEIREKQR